MIASSGSIDSAQVKALQSLLKKANGGEDEVEDKEKIEAEKEAQEKETKKMQEAAKVVESPTDPLTVPINDVEQIAKAIADDLGKMMADAQENTRLLAEPKGMFKNLSPDSSYEKDRKQISRTNTTVGKDYNPNGLCLKQPHVSKQSQAALKTGKL